MGLKTRIQSFGLSKATMEVEDNATNTETLSVKQEKIVAPLLLKILSPVELKFKESMHFKLLDILDLSMISGIDEKEARKQIRGALQKLFDEESVPLSSQTRNQIIKEIEDDILGLGPLEALLYDPTISDILVNNFEKVYVERFG
jgi:pilus assembly protein CpaF